MTTLCTTANAGACVAPRRRSPARRPIGPRVATIALALAALFAMVYGETFTLDRAKAGGRELAAVTSAIDAVSGGSNGLTVVRPARVATIKEDRHD